MYKIIKFEIVQAGVGVCYIIENFFNKKQSLGQSIPQLRDYRQSHGQKCGSWSQRCWSEFFLRHVSCRYQVQFLTSKGSAPLLGRCNNEMRRKKCVPLWHSGVWWPLTEVWVYLWVQT